MKTTDEFVPAILCFQVSCLGILLKNLFWLVAFLSRACTLWSCVWRCAVVSPTSIDRFYTVCLFYIGCFRFLGCLLSRFILPDFACRPGSFFPGVFCLCDNHDTHINRTFDLLLSNQLGTGHIRAR